MLRRKNRLPKRVCEDPDLGICFRSWRLARSKKAVTKECPVCLEQIPIRLLASHLDLERSRVEEIIGSIGKKHFDPDVLQAMLIEHNESEAGYE
jgi:hypothetical protein